MSGRGAERTLKLIEWLAIRTQPFTLSQVTQALDMPKSSASLMLKLFVEQNYLDKSVDNFYRVVRLPGEPDRNGLAVASLPRLLDDILEDTVAQSQESVLLAVLSSIDAVEYISKRLPKREITYDRDISRTRTPHHVASGIVLLAHSDPQTLDAYFASQTFASAETKAAAREKINFAKQHHYFMNLEGRVEGASGASAPIFNAQGDVIAALNIAGPSNRFLTNQAHIIQTTLHFANKATERVAKQTIR